MRNTIKVTAPSPETGRVMLVFETHRDDGSYGRTCIPLEFDQEIGIRFTRGEEPVDVYFTALPAP